jgi:uncharacterized membrane protein
MLEMVRMQLPQAQFLFEKLTLACLLLAVHLQSKKADKKVERLRKIVKEAAEQSHRSEIPEVHAPASIFLKRSTFLSAFFASHFTIERDA